MRSPPGRVGVQAYKEREEPVTIRSNRGCTLFTGQMVARLGSFSCCRSFPVPASIKSTGWSACPPKSSLIYLPSEDPQTTGLNFLGDWRGEQEGLSRASSGMGCKPWQEQSSSYDTGKCRTKPLEGVAMIKNWA